MRDDPWIVLPVMFYCAVMFVLSVIAIVGTVLAAVDEFL